MKLQELYVSKGDRSDFIDTWLFEMPRGSGRFETFDALKYAIRDFTKSGIKPVEVTGNLKRIIIHELYLYWYEKDEEIQLASELTKRPEGLVVSITGKDPSLKGSPPYASDLYIAILKDTDKNIRILSDKSLSDEGYSLWKKLLKLGHKVSVYNAKENPGQSMRSFHTPEEMDEFFKHGDVDFEKYQYVLSENINNLAYVRAHFNMRRAREIIHESNPLYSLEDH